MDGNPLLFQPACLASFRSSSGFAPIAGRRNIPDLSAAELQYIQSDPSEPATRIPWTKLLPHRQTWAFLIGKFMTDPIWWFFLFWLPKFLNTNHGLQLTALGLPLVVIYNAACVGSIGGGWLAARFLKAGWTVNAARKTAMLMCALTIVPIVAAANVHSLWAAVALVSLATAGHQGWSANMFTFASDLFPRRAVASCGGNRRIWRRRGWNVHCGTYRVGASGHRQLRTHLRYCRLRIPGCTASHPPAYANDAPCGP